jgi:hypothetical protein
MHEYRRVSIAWSRLPMRKGANREDEEKAL